VATGFTRRSPPSRPGGDVPARPRRGARRDELLARLIAEAVAVARGRDRAAGRRPGRARPRPDPA